MLQNAWITAAHDDGQVRLTATAQRGGEAKRSTTAAILAELRSIFLPVGYPESVRPEYLQFQIYDTLQAACSYLRSILTTSAILRGAGVGEDSASPMAAAVAWVLRDGVGMFGSLLFSYAVGANFDANVKEWRLFADLINDLGMTLDLLAPLAGSPTGFMVVAATGAACKTICGMTAGATRASITAHFALRGNLADVSAKESAQETAVTLIGLVAGTALASRLGDSAVTSWVAFIVLTLLHVWANWHGVGCLTFHDLNPQRAQIVARSWCAGAAVSAASAGPSQRKRSSSTTKPSSAAAAAASPSSKQRDSPDCDAALAPSQVSREERVWRPLYLMLRGPKLGVGLKALLDTTAADGGASQLGQLESIFGAQGYLLRLNAKGRPCVALRPAASGETVLKAMLHCAACAAAGELGGRWAVARARGSSGLGEEEALALRESLAFVDAQWEAFRAALEASGWVQVADRICVDHFAGPLRVRVGRGD